jgi:hypothetical protein
MAASYYDLGISAGFNTLIMLCFLILYSVFSRKPINARVYFTKWFDVDPEVLPPEPVLFVQSYSKFA